MKMFVALALLLPAFAVASEVQLEDRDGGEMEVSEHRQCYVYGQCQEFMKDFSKQDDAESCHAFCGKLDGCNWWSWEPEQSLCLAFENCTLSGGPSGSICEDCISGEKLCPARDCHEQHKCVGHFVDSFVMSHIEECIVACNAEDDCNWYTLEKMHDHCILYEDCDFHDESCTTCATGPKYCSHGYHAEDGTIFTQDNLEDLMNKRSAPGPLPVGQPCGDGDTCADGGRCHIRCCHKDLAMPDNVAECGTDGWYTRCKSGYSHDGMTGCVEDSCDSSTQFKCLNGQCKSEYASYDSRCSGSCMPKEWKCDGVKGCTDGSDESSETCRSPDWREDLRCGPNYPLQDGRPAQCDPSGVYPCCAPSGWCGNTNAHCNCAGCEHFK